MKYKRARSLGELTKAVTDEMGEGADKAAIAAEAAKRAEALKARGLLLEEWTLDDVQADLAWCGMSGSPTKVHRIQSVVLTGGEYHEVEPTDEGCAALVAELIEEHTIG